MGLLHGLWLLVVGALGAATIVARDRRGARVLTELEPYRGWIGVISAVIGAWRLFWVLLELTVFRWFNQWLLRAVDAALLLSLGLLAPRSFRHSAPSISDAGVPSWIRR